MRLAFQTRQGFGWGQTARVALVALAICSGASAARAQAVAKAQMQSLDEQVQEVKSDVLGIASELDQLEEKLLYPSNTQVAVFVSMDKDASFRLDSVSIQIDGQPVARHVYSFKELEALKKGGVQRIYTGNARTGEHKLDVSVAGKLGGEDYAGSQSASFSKEVGPKLVGVTLVGSGEPSIEIGGW
jgi:hypothetical protein